MAMPHTDTHVFVVLDGAHFAVAGVAANGVSAFLSLSVALVLATLTFVDIYGV